MIRGMKGLRKEGSDARLDGSGRIWSTPLLAALPASDLSSEASPVVAKTLI